MNRLAMVLTGILLMLAAPHRALGQTQNTGTQEQAIDSRTANTYTFTPLKGAANTAYSITTPFTPACQKITLGALPAGINGIAIPLKTQWEWTNLLNNAPGTGLVTISNCGTSCSGVLPVNATLCYPTAAPMTPTAYTYLDSCPAASTPCAVTCGNAAFPAWNGSTCVAGSACSGTLPDHASMCYPAATPVTPTAISFTASCPGTSTPCVATCADPAFPVLSNDHCCAYYQSWGGGNIPNACGCTPESDSAFCARLAICGGGSGMDNCGATRSAFCGVRPITLFWSGDSDCSACPESNQSYDCDMLCMPPVECQNSSNFVMIGNDQYDGGVVCDSQGYWQMSCTYCPGGYIPYEDRCIRVDELPHIWPDWYDEGAGCPIP